MRTRLKDKISRLVTPCIALFVALWATGHVCAADTTWDGSESNAWETQGNWDTDAVPTASDIAIVPANATITFGTGAVASALKFGTTQSAQNTISISGGDLTVGGEVWFGGANSTTEVTMSGGTLTCGSWFAMSRADTAPENSVNTFKLTGGNVNCNGNWVSVGSWSANGSTAHLNVSGTGEFYSLNGFYIGEHHTGDLTVSGSGKVTTPGKVVISKEAGDGDVYLDGGMISCASVETATDAGHANFTFNGGTLQAAASGTLIGSGITVTVGANGGTIDTNGKAVTIASAITGTGTLTISGGGVATFTTAPTCGLKVENGVAVLPENSKTGAIEIGAHGALAFDLTGKTITSGTNYTLAWNVSSLKVPTGENPADSIFTIGPDFTSTITYSGDWLYATATSDATYTGDTANVRYITTTLNGGYMDDVNSWINIEKGPNGAYNDSENNYANPNYQGDAQRRDIVVILNSVTVWTWGANRPSNFTYVVRGSDTTLTLNNGDSSTATDLVVANIYNTGTITTAGSTGGLNLTIDNVVTTGGTVTLTDGTLTFPAGSTFADIDADTVKVVVASQPATTDILLTTLANTTDINVVSDDYILLGEYDGSSQTTWKAVAYNGSYVEAFSDDFKDSTLLLANFRKGQITSSIFKTEETEQTTSGLTWITQQKRTVGDEEVAYARLTLANGNSTSTKSQTAQYLLEDFSQYPDRTLQFDWYAGAGYSISGKAITDATNGLAIVSAEGTILATAIVNYSSRDDTEASAKLYNGDDAKQEIASFKGSKRGNDPNNAGYWYRFTIHSTLHGTYLNMTKIADSTAVVQNYLLTTKNENVAKLAFYQCQSRQTQHTALANVKVEVSSLIDAVAIPSISSKGTGKDPVSLAFASDEGAVVTYWTSNDTQKRTYDVNNPPTLPNSGTVYAYAEKDGKKSLTASVYIYSNLGAITLNAPTIRRRGFSRVNISSSQSNLTGQPTVAYTYKGGTMAEAAEAEEGNTVNVTLPGLDGASQNTITAVAKNVLYANSSQATLTTAKAVSTEDYVVVPELSMDFVDYFSSHNITLSFGDVDVDGSNYLRLYRRANGVNYDDFLPANVYVGYEQGNMRWGRTNLDGLSRDNNDSLFYFPTAKKGDLIYFNAQKSSAGPGVEVNAEYGATDEAVYVVTSDEGGATINIGNNTKVYAFRLYRPAVAKTSGIGYLTIDEAIEAAMGENSVVTVVDADAINGQAVTLKPGVSVIVPENVTPGTVTVTTEVGGDTVDMTGYYSTATLTVVDGKITPELDKEQVAPKVAEGVTVKDTTVTIPATKLKKGLYYRVVASADVAGTGTKTTGAWEPYSGSGSLSLTAELPESGVLYYAIEASDTAQ